MEDVIDNDNQEIIELESDNNENIENNENTKASDYGM